MITEINLKNITSYHPTENESISDLKKVNFFFGNNGSGKSTIAKYLYNLDVKEEEDKSITFNSCTQSGYSKENHQILVFDEKFIERNFIDNDIQLGIFSLNEKNEEIDTKIKEEQSIIQGLETYKAETLANRKIKLENQKNKWYKDLKDYCFNKRKNTIQSFLKIKDDFPKKQTQNNYDAIIAVKNIIGPKPLVPFEKLSNDYTKYYNSDLERINLFLDPALYKNIRKKELELNKLLQEVIVGNSDVDIAVLINDLGIRSWVEKGTSFLNDKLDTQTCPFCQKETIDKLLLDKFSQYFDESYKQKIQKIEDLKEEHKSLLEDYIEKLNNLIRVFNENNIASNLHTKIKDLLEDNEKIIIDKIKNSNEKKELKSIFSFKEDITAINKVIEKQNKDFDNLDKNKQYFIENIWYHLLNETIVEIEKYKSREIQYSRCFDLIKSQSDIVTNKITESKKKIDDWRENTVSTKKAVESINTILKNSGFKGFEIKEKEVDENKISQYFLKRDDGRDTEVFKTLSEGEKNFIAFLYFYQLCLGADKAESDDKQKIIVIDDPASSIDSQSIFIISTLIHQLIARKGNDNRPNRRDFLNSQISQVFILTHNIFFYKEVSLDNSRGSTNRQFYLVSKSLMHTKIELKAEKEISNDYSLMWSSLKRIKQDVADGNKDYNILIGNVMRRILESYVNFIGIGKRVWNSIKDVSPADTRNIICSSLISEINDTSHKVSPLDDIYFTRITNVTPNSLFDVFKLIFKEIGKEHYELMMNEIFEDEEFETS